jgi:hypothetical protein
LGLNPKTEVESKKLKEEPGNGSLSTNEWLIETLIQAKGFYVDSQFPMPEISSKPSYLALNLLITLTDEPYPVKPFH